MSTGVNRNRLFRGLRTPEGCVVTVEPQYGSRRELDPRLDVHNHSPDGFEWGYGGSGPAQLALAMLCEHFQDIVPAQRWYQEFKFRVVARLPHDRWELTTKAIDAHIQALEAECESRT